CRTIHPGDLVFGDEDGVVVLPAAQVATVLDAAQRRVEDEQALMEALAKGQRTLDWYGWSQPHPTGGEETMLTKEKNMRLTQVGPDTPGGKLLRRYWHPVAAVDELMREPTKSVRLLGEDLVLYRDASGRYGMLERHCSHRSADLSYGVVEEEGLRCNDHGWLFGATGACIEQRYQDTVNPAKSLRKNGRLKAYPVREKAGLLWAYMGPEPAPAPELPDWEAFSWPNGFVQIVFADVPCNWVQAQENSI